MNNPPRLTLITLDYPPDRGGVATYLSSLVKASHGTLSVVVDTNHAAPATHVDSRTFFWGLWPGWWPLVDVCGEYGHHGRMLLVSHVFPVGTAAWISKKFHGPEYAVVFHGLDLRRARGPWKRWLLRRVVKNANAVFVNSESTKSELTALVPSSQPHVLTPGVDVPHVPSRQDARRALGIDPDEKLVVSLARFVPRKGIDTALNAMARIQHAQNVRYVVLGDGSDRSRLESIANKHRAQVTWVRKPTDVEKWQWLAAADVFLLPVRDEGDDVEGFGIVFLEAAAASVPSVAGKSGGAPEAVRHERTGLLVNPNSVDEIVEAVARLLNDETLRQTLGEKGKARVTEDFRWSDRWSKLAKILAIE